MIIAVLLYILQQFVQNLENSMWYFVWIKTTSKLIIFYFPAVFGDNQPAAKQLPEENELTGLFDYEKYLKLQANQMQRFEKRDQQPINKTQCLDSEHEVYQECGNKCVLACRYSVSTSVLPSENDECVKAKCIEGCFCKAGFVRNGNKCIPASQCPVPQKCHNRNEAYVSASVS